jgi:3-oxoacyl-[acyl-carrier protein] reductase
MVLQGKTAVVTAAAGNVALAVVRGLLEEGAQVALVDIDAMRLDNLIRFVRGNTVAVPADSSDAAAVRQALQQVEKQLGPVDILVNATEDPMPARLEALDTDAWRRAMARNLDSAFNWSQAVLPGMKKRGWGRIVSLVSPAAKGAAVDASAAEAAAHGGLVSLTFALARDAAPHGVTVNAIAVAYVENSPTIEMLNDSQRRQILAGVPLGRFCKPEELAHAARFLASPLAGFITGEILDVNGGVVMD